MPGSILISALPCLDLAESSRMNFTCDRNRPTPHRTAAIKVSDEQQTATMTASAIATHVTFTNPLVAFGSPRSLRSP